MVLSEILIGIYTAHSLVGAIKNDTESYASYGLDAALEDLNINITDEVQLFEVTDDILEKYGFQNISSMEKAARCVATSLNYTRFREKALENVRNESNVYSRNDFEFICSLGLYLSARTDNSDAAQFFLNETAYPYLIDGKNRHALHIASVRGNYEIITNILLTNPVGINWKDSYGLTPLFMAVVRNRTEVCKLLLRNGADAGMSCEDGRTPLYVAITKGLLPIARLLIASKKEIVNTCYGGLTMLQTAFANYQIEMLELLVENGADPFASYSNRSTPLHLAVEMGDTLLADVLTLKTRAGIDKKDSQGNTALVIAAQLNHTDIVKLLVRRGANPMLPGNIGLLPLHFAASYDNGVMCESLVPVMKKRGNTTSLEVSVVYGILSQTNLNVLECLLREDASSFAQDGGMTLIHLAAAFGTVPSLQLILQHLPETLDAVVLDGRTPLYYALVNNLSDVSELLLNRGADPMLISKHHALHLGVMNKRNKIVELMLPSYRKHHLIDAKDEHNETVLCLAARLHCAIIVRTLLLNGANPYIFCGFNTALHLAVYNRDITTVEIILYYHREAKNMRNYHRRTPLHLAVELGDLEVTEYLVKVGANPYIPCYDDLPSKEVNKLKKSLWIHLILGAPRSFVDFRRLNSLFSAVIDNNLPIVQLLMQADHPGKNNQNLDGHSVLHISVMEGYATISRYLLRAEISPRLKDNRSWTALHYAVDSSDFVHSDMILSAWVSKSDCIHYKTNEGLTPLSILTRKKSNDTKLLKLVLSGGAGCDSLDEVMHYAVEMENVEVAELLLTLNVNINIRNSDVTPLILAARTKSLLMTKYLVGQHADPNLYDTQGKTALHVAALVKSIPIVEALLDNNETQINAQDINGITPMWEAALQNCLGMFHVLLYRGADPNIFTIKGLTVFHAIAAEGNLELTVILSNKIDFDLKTNNGTSALIIAILNNRILVFNFLLDKRADPNMADGVGKTSLHHAAESSNPEFIEAILSKANQSLNRPDILGNTPLMLCIKRKHISPEFILKYGANPSIRNANGYSAIHVAAMSGNIQAMNLLTDFHGINIDSFDARNHTALMVAAMHGESPMVRYLLEKEADPCLISAANTSVLHYLVCYNDLEIIEKVYNSINSTCNGKTELNRQDIHGKSLLACSAAKAIDRVFFYLVGNGADLFAVTTLNKTLLHFAAEGGGVNITKYILRNAATLLESTTLVGESPLFFAARYGNDKVFELLLKYGTQRTPVSIHGETLLHAASFGGNVHIASILLEVRETDLEATDVEGNTPLAYAVCNERLAMTEFLIGKGANVLAINVNGENVLKKAASTGNVDLLQTLIKDSKDTVDSLIGVVMLSNNENLTPEKLGLLLSQSTIAENDVFFAAAMGDDEKLKDVLKHENKPLKRGFPQLMFEFTQDYEPLLKDQDESIPSYRAVLTPLDLAVLFLGKINTVKLLINHFNIQVKNSNVRKSLWTVLDLACFSAVIYDKHTSKEKELVFRYLLKNAEPLLNHSDKFGWNIVHKAAWVGNSRAIYALHQKGVDVNKVDNYGRLPLHIAAMKGFHEAVRVLLHLSSESVNCYDDYGFTPLHLTQIYRIKKFYRTLTGTVAIDPEQRYKLVANVKLDRIRSRETRPRDYLLTMKTLLQFKANIDLQDRKFRWTPLQWAAAGGDLDTTAFLVTNGASVNVPSSRDESPMYLARFWRRRDVYLFLKTRNGVW